MQSSESNIISFNHTEKDRFYIDRIEILDPDGNALPTVHTWDAVIFRIFFHASSYLPGASVDFQISTKSGFVIFYGSTRPDCNVPVTFSEGENWVDCRFEKLTLAAGEYVVGAGLAVPNVQWLYQSRDAGLLKVWPQDVFNSALPPQESRCLIPMPHQWRVYHVTQ
jgi:hypothetical protein